MARIEGRRGQQVTDYLYGTTAADEMWGYEGHDLFYGSAGADTLFGGEGNDRVSYASSVEAVEVNLQTRSGKFGDAEGDRYGSIENVTGSQFNDVIIGDGASNRLYGYGGRDTLNGGAGNDSLKGGTGSDSLLGGSGSDHLEGGADNDTLSGGAGHNYLFGDAGVDTATYEFASTGVYVDLSRSRADWGYNPDTYETNFDLLQSIENVTGSRYADYIEGDDEANRLSGFDGDDELVGGGGADTLIGGEGNDEVSYGLSMEGVRIDLANSANNTGSDAAGDTYSSIESIRGSSFDDELYGNESDNTMEGGLGRDDYFGRGGADTFRMRTDDAIADGGDGFDTANFYYMNDENGGTNLIINLANGAANGSASGGGSTVTLRSIENVESGGGNDVINGNNVANRLEGASGNDTLDGGLGSDTLTGGYGNDVFKFRNDDDDPDHDVITDFENGKDRLNFANIDWDYDSWSDLQDENAIAQVGNDTVITIGDGTITLEGIDADTISAADFIF